LGFFFGTTPRLAVGIEQGLDSCSQLGMARAGIVEEGRAVRGWFNFEHPDENGFDLGWLVFHGGFRNSSDTRGKRRSAAVGST
jgi:hypothetical protein